MIHPMKPGRDSESTAAYNKATKLAAKNPMPDDLREQIANWIEPETVNTETDHADVMSAIAIAYPLIRDYHAGHGAAGADA